MRAAYAACSRGSLGGPPPSHPPPFGLTVERSARPTCPRSASVPPARPGRVAPARAGLPSGPGASRTPRPALGPLTGTRQGRGRQGTHRPQTRPLAGAPRLRSVATRGWWLLNWTARAQDVAKATPPGSGTPNQICFLALVHKSVWPERSQERCAKCSCSSAIHESASRVPGPGRTRE